MLYYPSAREIERLQPKLKEMLCASVGKMKEPLPIKTEQQAREYLLLKVSAYRNDLAYSGGVETIVDKYIAKAMNTLLASGFTYVNLYAKDTVFLREPHVASALAFNELNHIADVPDTIDLQYGLRYEREEGT